jgi:hypothetical protein
MTEIKTPNWRLASVSPQSTGHQYKITDRRTGQSVYFDNVIVRQGCFDEVTLWRDDEEGGQNGVKAGKFDNTEQFPEVILDALKHLEEGGLLSNLGTRLNENPSE